jgi:hypothetical protein
MSKRIGRWGDEGVTVTLVHRLTRERRTVHEPGQSRRTALRLACFHFDPCEWRADVISTPQSIYDDVAFTRNLVTPTDGERGRDRGQAMQLARSNGGVITGEAQMLTVAGCRAWL